MRWQSLFDDLEAQLAAVESAELVTEVAERSRLEVGRVPLADRLAAARGLAVAVALPGHGVLRGTALEGGVDWLLLDEGAGRQVLVPLAAVLSVTGLPRGAVPAADGVVGRSLDLRWALRGLARGRAAVALGLRDGSAAHGTLDRVGADHVDLAEHPPGEARRAVAVRGVRVVPLAALVLVRST